MVESVGRGDTVVRLVCRFALGEQLQRRRAAWVSIELAGQMLQTTIDDRVVEVRFPTWTPRALSPAYIGTMGDDPASPDALAPTWIEVSTDEVVEGAEPTSDDLEPAFSVLRTAAARIVDQSRAGQPWTGMVGASPSVVSISATDTDTGEAIDVARLGLRSGAIVVSDRWLTGTEVEHALRGDRPSTADSLLAQARYLAQWADDPQPAIAVLLAAIACEANAKAVLLDAATGATRSLLDVLLRNPRTFNEPAAELYGFVAEAVLGQSLRSADRDLFNRLAALFQRRNRIAHRADAPTTSEARDHVRTAIAAFEWLAAVAG